MQYKIVSLFKNILFIPQLQGSRMVNDIGDAVSVPVIADDADVIAEDHKIAGLPCMNIINVIRQNIFVLPEVHDQVFHPPEIDVDIRHIDVIALRMSQNILIHLRAKIIA